MTRPLSSPRPSSPAVSGRVSVRPGDPAGNQAMSLASGHPPDSPPGSLNQVASATLPGPSEVQTMGDGAVRKRCPGCGGTHVAKNGRRGGRQQYRCQSEECRCQFNDSANAFNQRFPAQVIAKSIDLRLNGLPYKEVSAEASSAIGAKIPEATILRWVEKYVGLAAEEVRKLAAIDSGLTLGIEYASLRPAKGGCWLVQDLNTGYVLADLVGSFDPDTAQGGNHYGYRA